ncbi:hypothetical protein FOZ61_008003 [Perkinsus olseni]|uniref:Uncharacterized protein n=1 Tax=Perkinsus olseni TaxID=32597 RepID=A0A7J6L6K1_PEROL|nr:hypothetical protein FOZ61_008003 [Perkinsus olseni]
MSGVIGIDLGTADAIVASVGRGVVDIVRNEVSERKTPCVVGFTDKNRLIGEAAMTSIKSNYKNTCRNPKQLLGRSSPDDEELKKEKFFQICDNAIADDGLDPLKNAKARFKLEEAVNKVKKILSANNEAVLGIECLMGDEDLNAVVTRDKLEELCTPMIGKMQSVMDRALKEANVTADDLHSVEIIGGVSRVPFIQRTIVDTLHKGLSRTLNADECVARGCALQAAMLSPLFKVRDFAVTDFSQQGVEVAWKAAAATSTGDDSEQQHERADDDTADGSASIKRTEVFQPRSTLNMVKMLTFYRKDAFDLWAQYPNSKDASLGRFTVQVPHSDGAPKKIKVRAKLSLHGTFSIENATMIEEEEYQVVEKERRPKDKQQQQQQQQPAAGAGAGAGAAGDDDDDDDDDDDVNMPDASPSATTTTNADHDVNMQPAETAPSDKEEYEEVEVTKTKTRTEKTEIPIIRCGVPGMTEEQLIAAEDDESKMRGIDREVAETDEKRNELESYVFESRDKISSPSSKWYEFLSAAQRDELSNILMQTEDWIYDHYDATKAEYMDKLIAIRPLGDGAEYRASEASLRPEAEAKTQDAMQKYRSLAQSPDVAYSHIAIERKQHIIDECQKLESWLSQQKALQARQPLYDTPVYTVADLNAKTDALIKLADGILSEKPPKKEEKQQSTTTNDASESPSADDTPAAGGDNGESSEEEGGAGGPTVEEVDSSSPDASTKYEASPKDMDVD